MSENNSFHGSPLDQALLSACISMPPDYARIEELLRHGADPLGAVIYQSWFGPEPRNLYAAVIHDYLFREDLTDWSETLAAITELFCRAGMDLNKPAIPYDDDSIFHPVNYFKFFGDGRAELPLIVLLDYGMDYISAEECWNDAIYTMMVTHDELTDPEEVDGFIDIITKTLLCASYPHIWENDKHLREFLESEKNDYDPRRFRDWEQYSFSVDTSYSDREFPKPSFALVSVLDNRTGEIVWRFRFGWSKKPLPHTMVMMIGIPGSGKSTFYRKNLADKYAWVNLDTLHTRPRESQYLDQCFAHETEFCVDNTNLTRAERAYYIAKAKARGWRVVGYFMKSVLKDCIARNDQRDGDARLPAKAVAAMSNRMELPRRDEGFDELYFVEIRDGDYVISEWRDDK